MANKIKEIIGSSRPLFICRVFAEKTREALFLIKRLSSGRSDWRKIEPVLRVEVHAIEKGMSIGKVRPGFGKAKASDFMEHLQRYIDVGGRQEFVNECCSILCQYVDFNQKLGADMNDIDAKIKAFCEKNHAVITVFGGVRNVSKSEVYETLNKDFSSFSQSRFAVRDFGKEPISRQQIEDALKIAEKTPSACNRQSWKIHVYAGDDKRLRMFQLQGGSKGFYEDMQYAILVCGDLNYYRFFEMSQIYVDGGLYAMNLMYALHYKGVATIPLTMSIRVSKMNNVIKEMKLTKNELPVLLIGVGSYKDEFNVAKSERVPYQEYSNFEE